MTVRLDTLFSVLPECKKFADVGCDHGYLSLAMISSGKAKDVVCTDISAPSLQKCKELFKDKGLKAKFICCDGLTKVDCDCDLVLISGMGGETIIDILSSSPFLPEKLVLQPMKNVDKVRSYVVSIGYKIVKDFKFFAEGKYYDVISLERGEDSLTLDEITYGRDNLQNPSEDFLNFLSWTIEKKTHLLESLPDKEIAKKELEKIKELYGRLYFIKNN